MTGMSSAQRKLYRGAEQIKTLQTEAASFAGSEAYVFETKLERRSQNELFYRNYATQRIAPPDHWPLLAGEAIQNIRSALDHAAWAAWRAIEENTGDGDRVQFPICDSPRKWKNAQGRLEGVPDSVRTVIESAQPYNRWPERPEGAPIAVLRDMSNADKHRRLALVVGAVTFEMAGVSLGYDIKDWSYASGKRLSEGTAEVSSFTVYSTDGSELDETKVTPQFSYGVAIESIGPDTLKMFVHEVFEIVTEIETGSPPPPFAPYPV